MVVVGGGVGGVGGVGGGGGGGGGGSGGDGGGGSIDGRRGIGGRRFTHLSHSFDFLVQ